MRRDLDDIGNRMNNLNNLADQSQKGLGRMFQIAGGLAFLGLLENVTSRMGAFIKESTVATARIEEMDKVLSVLGRNAGFSSGQINEQTRAIEHLGIQTGVAQESLAQFLKFNLDVSKAGELARVAQDVAVLGGQDSSQTLQSMLWGITTRQPEIIRRAGLTVNFEQEFSKLAAERGKSVSALTENEKIQASLNAVIREGTAVEGAYEKAMESASKQLRSRERYIDNLQTAVGNMFTEIWSAQVFAGNDLIKWMTDALDEDGAIASAVSRGTRRMTDSFQTFWNNAKFQLDSAKSNGVLDSLAQAVGSGSNMMANGGALAGLGTAGGIAAGARLLSPVTGMLGLSSGSGMAGPLGLLVGMVTASQDLRDGLLEAAKAGATAFAQLMEGAEPFVEAVNHLLAALGDGLAVVLDHLVDALPAFVEMAVQVMNVATAFIEVAATILEIEGMVQALVVLFLGIKLVGFVTSLQAGLTTILTINGALAITQGAMLGIAAAAGLVLAGLAAVAYLEDKRNDALDEAAMKRAESVRTSMGGDSIAALSKLKTQREDALAARSTGENAYDSLPGFAKNGVFQSALKLGGPFGNAVGSALQMGSDIFRDSPADQARRDYEQAMKAWGPEFADQASETLATVKQNVQELEDQADILNAALSLPVATWAESLELLPAQQKVIGDFLSQLIQQTKTWRDEMSSIPKAASDAAQEFAKANEGKLPTTTVEGTTDALKLRAAEARNFMSNVSKLQDMGADSNLLQQYLKAGPESAGEGLRQMMGQLEGMAPEAASKVIKTWQDEIASIGTAVDLGLQQLAVDLMQGDIQLDTPEAVNELVTKLKSQSAEVENATAQALGILEGGWLGEQEAAVRKQWDSMQTAIAEGNKDAASEAANNIAQLVDFGLQQGKIDGGNKELVQGFRDLALSIGLTAASTNEMTEQFFRFMGLEGKTLETATDLADKISAAKTARASLQAKVNESGGNANLFQQGLLDAYAGNIEKLQGKQQKLLDDGLKGQTDAQRAADEKMLAEQEAADAAMLAAEQQRQASNAAQKAVVEQKDAVEELANAYNKVYGILGEVQSSTHSLAQAKEDMAATIGTSVLMHENEASLIRQVEQQATSAAEAIKTQAFAMAESGQIGRDVGSINSYIGSQLDQLTGSLEANVNAWIAEKGELIQVNAYMEKLSETWDKGMNVMRSSHAATKAQDSALQAIYSTARLVNPTAREMSYAQMEMEEAIIGAIGAIQAEAQALAASGQIGQDWGSISAYITDRVLDLRNEVTKLSSAWAEQGETLEDLDSKLARVRKGYEEYLDLYINEGNASYSTRDAMRQLYGVYRENTAALSGYNTNAHERDILTQQMVSSLNTVVSSIRSEAEALAKTGKLGADAASQHEFLTKRLKDLQKEYPELSSVIEEYLGHIANIPEEKPTQADFLKDTALGNIDFYLTRLGEIPTDEDTNARVFIEAALATIRSYRQAMEAWIPREYQTNMKVNVDANSLNQARGQLQGLVNTADSIVQKVYEVGRVAATNTGMILVDGRPVNSTLLPAVQSAGNAIKAAFGGARAFGGSTMPGQSYLVGEKGPELLEMGAGAGFVTPLDQLASPTSGTHIEHLEVNSTAPPREWLEEAAWLVKQEAGL